MTAIHDLHREAMRLADEADRLRCQGDKRGAGARLEQAFESERQAAERSAAEKAPEPTRSVLHRSAASLAVECGRYRDAERLIAVALAGNPPDEIAEELRDLLARVYFDSPVRTRRRALAGTAE